MKRRTPVQIVGKFILQLIVRVGPIALVVYFAVGKLDLQKSQTWYFGLILGTVLSLWALFWWLDWKTGHILDIIAGTKDLRIRVLGQKEVLPTIKWLYRSTDAKFYATHIGYRDVDRTESDAEEEDIAAHLYTERAEIPYQRIVQVAETRDREWVEHMMEQCKNGNYAIRCLEEPLSAIPYPNFLIVEKNDGNSMLFMSFRAATPDGSGHFAFLSQNPDVIRGVREHFDRFFNRLPSANDCLKQWRSA